MSDAHSNAGRRKRADRLRANDRRAALRAGVAIPIDSVADAAIAARAAEATVVRCDVCEHPVGSEPTGHGLYVWSRGEERRYEEPPLCERCATVLGLSALNQWRRDEEEDE